jgi:hypothetical protein
MAGPEMALPLQFIDRLNSYQYVFKNQFLIPCLCDPTLA